MVALLLALAGVPAYQQFTPGRIDHHNVQIALALLVTAATVWSDRKSLDRGCGGRCSPAWRWRSASRACPISRSAAACWRCATCPIPTPVWRCATTVWRLRAGTALALSHQRRARPPGRLHRCDAIALNNAAAAMSAGLVLALAAWLKHADGVTRVFAVAGAGCLAARGVRAARAALRRAGRSRWSIRRSGRSGTIMCADCSRSVAVFRTNPLTAAAIAAFPALALVAMLKLMTEREASPRLRLPHGELCLPRRGRDHARGDPRLFLCDLAWHAAGRRARAAAVRRAADSSGSCRGLRPGCC